MSRIVRTIALSGAAAAALFATAGTASATTPEVASVTVESAVTAAAGAPVTLPSGKTIRITGMDSVSYRADDSHRATVVTLADSPTGGVGSDLSSSPQPGGGFDPRLDTPNPQYGNQQPIQTQASGGVIGAGVVAILLLGVIAFFRIKKRDVKGGDAVLFVFLGVALSGTIVGAMASNLTNTGIGSLGNLLGGL